MNNSEPIRHLVEELNRPAAPTPGFVAALASDLFRDPSGQVTSERIGPRDGLSSPEEFGPATGVRPPLARVRRRAHRPWRTAVVSFMAVMVAATATIWLVSRFGADSDPTDQADVAAEPAERGPHLGVVGESTITLPDSAFPRHVVTIGDSLAVLADLDRVDPGAPPGEQAVLMVLDTETGSVESIVRLADHPLDIAVAGDDVWVTHWLTGSLTRVELGEATSRPSGVVLPPLPDFDTTNETAVFVPNDIVVELGTVWVLTARGALTSVDADSGRVLSTVRLEPPHPRSLAVDEHSVWVAEDIRGIERLDIETGAITRVTSGELGHVATQLVSFGGEAFVAGEATASPGTYALSSIDGDTGTAIHLLDARRPILFLGVIDEVLVAVDSGFSYWILSNGGQLSGPKQLALTNSNRLVFTSAGAWSLDYEAHTLQRVALEP